MVFVAVHIGAGNHAVSKRESYQKACKNACEAAMSLLKNNSNAVDSVVEAIRYLEDDVITNAGYGSNLNINGEVECDASLMDGTDLLFGSVGAVKSIRNPIKIAQLILEKQRKSMPLGLIPPNFLVGEGARKFAFANGMQTFNLVSNKSQETHNKYKRQLEDHNNYEKNCTKHQCLDTVGAICLDHNGNVASGVSSGGLLLKQEGRVGQAAVIGAGCWAQKNISVTTSGVGEYLTRTFLARKCVESFLHQSVETDTLQKLNELFTEQFFESVLMKNVPRCDHLAGILGLLNDPESKYLELFWGHSTATMSIGYMSSSLKSPISFISEMTDSSNIGFTIMAQSKLFKL